MNNRNLKIVITALLFALAIACFIIFEIVKVQLVNDVIMNYLLGHVIYHVVIAALLIWLAIFTNTTYFMRFKRNFSKMLLWSIPCFLVALANFPFSALITKSVTIDRIDLLGLYTLYVISVAVIEEFVFRGVLLILLLDLFRYSKVKYTLSALISSAIFALFHFTNLFTGMDIGSILLQVLYTFLIGAMLSIVMFKTNNVWLCVVIHALFDFGGLLTVHIAMGNPWDVTFWILTITCGILCAGHVIVSLINLERKHVSGSSL